MLMRILRSRDLAVARRFYERTLGLAPVHEEDGELVVYKSGNSLLNVYRSDYAGTNRATAVTWTVDDVDGEVQRPEEAAASRSSITTCRA